jgi:hypothetical protein
MKHSSVSQPEPPPPAPTLQDVVDLVGGNADLSATRRRDLRSAVVTYGKVVGEPLSTIPMALAAIRKTLDGVVPMQAKVSRKRWANLRSDLAAAIATSGLQPMLKTAGVEPSNKWQTLLDAADDKERPLPARPVGQPTAGHAGRDRRCGPRALLLGTGGGEPCA